MKRQPCIYIKVIFIVCGTSKATPRGKTEANPPDAARGWERVGKRQGRVLGSKAN